MSTITDAFIKSRKKDESRIVQMSIPTRCLFVSRNKRQYLNEYWIFYYVTDAYDIGLTMGTEKIDLKYFLWGFSTGYIPPGDYLTSKYDYRIFSDSQKWSWEYDKYKKNIKDWGF